MKLFTIACTDVIKLVGTAITVQVICILTVRTKSQIQISSFTLHNVYYIQLIQIVNR